MENVNDHFKKMAGEALITATKAESNVEAFLEVFKWFLEKKHPELKEEFATIFINARNKAITDIIANSATIPAKSKETAAQRMKDGYTPDFTS